MAELSSIFAREARTRVFRAHAVFCQIGSHHFSTPPTQARPTQRVGLIGPPGTSRLCHSSPILSLPEIRTPRATLGRFSRFARAAQEKSVIPQRSWGTEQMPEFPYVSNKLAGSADQYSQAFHPRFW